MFGLRETSTIRRAVALVRPMAVSSDTIAASESSIVRFDHDIPVFRDADPKPIADASSVILCIPRSPSGLRHDHDAERPPCANNL